MRRSIVVAVAAMATVVLAACSSSIAVPPTAVVTASSATPPTSGRRWVDEVFADVTVTRDQQYATAPSLVDGSPEALTLDVYQPAGDTMAARPAIVFIHGGGFHDGDSDRLVEQPAAYARRGYVTVSIDYRLNPNTTCQSGRAAGTSASPGCAADIVAAQHDAQAAVRWLRANAAQWGIDPARIAALGFSAGAVTAANLAFRADDPGDVGDDLTQDSRVQAAIVVSGCEYRTADIGAGDAPTFFVHASGDPLVPFACAQADVAAAQSAGLVVEHAFYDGEAGHARALYVAHQAELDARWTQFLVNQLQLS